MTILQSEALCESKSLRTEALSQFSLVDLESVLTAAKVHSLFQAFWKNEGWATTAQISQYYEVSEEVVRQAVTAHRDEFVDAGYSTPKWSELKQGENSETFSFFKGRKLPALFNPRAAVLLGMLLRDSVIAKAVRAALLQITENYFALSLEIKRLKEENQHLREVIDSKQHSQQESEVGVSSETMELLGEMSRVVEAYIASSDSLNKAIHTSIHQQSEKLRLAFENLRRLHDKTLSLPGLPQKTTDEIVNLVKLAPRLSVIERRQAVITFLELIDKLPEDDERRSWSCRQIGAFLGVPYSTVNKIRQEHHGRRETPLRYRKV
jgi:hypothetical protein